ncbi:hypothetical protein NL676_038652 [Syzygium grande]|nr:hypothetical protein NL676_038652 [Syzygium grande]
MAGGGGSGRVEANTSPSLVPWSVPHPIPPNQNSSDLILFLFHSFPLPSSIFFLPILTFSFRSPQTPPDPLRETRLRLCLTEAMAAASAAVCPVPLAASAAVVPRQRKSRVNYIVGLNSFGGLKAHSEVASLGVPVCTDRSFAKIVSSLRSQGKSRSGGGGALSSTCNAAEEIFRIAAIMNGLVLIGVAVGFVLLRIEASVEEAE